MVTKDDLIPPPELLPPYARRGGFRQMGEAFLETCIQRGGLKPSDRVLDLGCGVGRFAVALTDYLNEQGSYEGLDVSARAIRIGREWITSKCPKFRFQQVAAHNQMYSPRIKRRAQNYRFPFEGQSFDFVFSNSLFTHLLPDATINYFREISRALKPGGRTLNSLFLLNQDSKALIEAGACPISLSNDMGVYRIKDAAMPEAFVAYEQDFLVKVHREAGLELLGPVRYGAWCGRSVQDKGFGGKDLVTAIKLELEPRGRNVFGRLREGLRALRR